MGRQRGLSHRLSYVLRHAPESVGLTLDPQGWADVPALLAALGVDRADLERTVAADGKQRFALDGDRVRAQQGHSVDVDLGLAPLRPPDRLWHGTSERVLDAVLREGLRPGRRRHVHLSGDPGTARQVGVRHGRPVVLAVDAAAAWAAGQVFWRAGNGVWLTGPLAPQHLSRSPG